MAITKINVDHMARIEGHGNVHLLIKDGELENVEMNVTEAVRLFEAMVVGRSFRETSYICSRVCGICSATHVVTDLQCIERIFDVEVSERSKLLRQLLIYGSFLQNHASHLFVFAVPDFIGQPSVFPLADADPALFKQALGLKRLGNDLCTTVGGRSIHPITAVVGGFTSEPAPILNTGDFCGPSSATVIIPVLPGPATRLIPIGDSATRRNCSMPEPIKTVISLIPGSNAETAPPSLMALSSFFCSSAIRFSSSAAAFLSSRACFWAAFFSSAAARAAAFFSSAATFSASFFLLA